MINNQALKIYIDNNILPEYFKNDLGHNIDHINYVIERSLKFSYTIPEINYNMVYTIASYHDIGHHIDAKNHEKVSSEILLKDENLKKFFSEEEIMIMSEAIYDHRASLEYEPRSIYGKIVSSADRNCDVNTSLIRTYEYRVKHNGEYFLDKIIAESREHLKNKFGENGYANDKIYFEDNEYKEYLDEIAFLVSDEDLFINQYLKVNKIDSSIYVKIFNNLKANKPDLSLDELLYETYIRTRVKETDSFDKYRNIILEANGLAEK